MKKSNRLAPYLLSLPERSLRSLTALGAGLLRETSEIVIPAHFRRTRLYGSIVDQTLRFLIEQVGEVKGAYQEAAQLPEDFFIRRSAGNGLDWVSLAVFHVSPVWVLAGLSDLSGTGGKVLGEIAGSLEKEGLLQGSSRIRSMSQLLEALERGSGHLAETMNSPPLNIPALRKEWESLKSSIETPPPAAAVEAEWQHLTSTAQRLDRPVLEVSTAVALSTIRGARKILTKPILEHYAQALGEIEKIGFVPFVNREMKPYLQAAASSFSREHRSTTEALLLKARRRLL